MYAFCRVLVSAVKKEHINLKLHFFNNCFNDDHCKHCEYCRIQAPLPRNVIQLEPAPPLKCEVYSGTPWSIPAPSPFNFSLYSMQGQCGRLLGTLVLLLCCLGSRTSTWTVAYSPTTLVTAPLPGYSPSTVAGGRSSPSRWWCLWGVASTPCRRWGTWTFCLWGGKGGLVYLEPPTSWICFHMQWVHNQSDLQLSSQGVVLIN